jgi:uncharacterized protein
MMTFDRQGIHIEQCEGCRGIFLDRGELEQIVGAEQRHYGGAPPYGGGHAAPPPPAHHGYHSDSPPHYRHGHHYSDSPRPYGHKRRKSFLEELFD